MRRYGLVVLALVLPACSDGPELSRAAPPRSPSPTPVATVATAPLSPPPSPAVVSPAAVEPSAAASGPVAVPAAAGDVDGDGEPDRVTAGSELAVELSGSGRTVTAPLSGDAPPAVRGAEDVDRDGRAEVFVRTAQGASTTFLTPYRYDGAELGPLLLDGQPLALGVGGSATHGEGFSCTDDAQLVVRRADRQQDGTWEVSAVTYDVRGAALEQVDASQRVEVAEDDPAVGQAYLLDCRSVSAD